MSDQPGPLVEPPEITPIESAIENCELMLEESIADELELEATGRLASPRGSYLGYDHDYGYAQGRKDACRVILISLGKPALGKTTDTERRQHEPR